MWQIGTVDWPSQCTVSVVCVTEFWLVRYKWTSSAGAAFQFFLAAYDMMEKAPQSSYKYDEKAKGSHP